VSNSTPPAPGAGAGKTPPDAPADRLWARWRQGERPDLDAFLAQAGSLTPGQLAAVLRVDQRERWRAGKRVLAESYLQRYPCVAADADGLLDLVYNEFLLRDQRGEGPTAEEYLHRFPDHAEALQPLLELHRAMAREDQAETMGPSWSKEEHDGDAPEGRPCVPGYEVLGELGRGGMGVVYKARQVSLNRVVALKMILAGPHADAEARRRFKAEAEAVARLQHPNIIQVYEHGYSAGHAYLALEYVEGGTLTRQTAGVHQPPEYAAQVVETLATAVHYAHCRGFVHRDLKPANVLVTADGALKITDFGLAKWLHDAPGGDAAGAPTRTGVLVGTPAYMAPEQAAGSRDIGPAADVYALGVILYQLLTGRVPFQGDSALEVLRQVKEEEPPAPRRLRPGILRDVETVCLKCLRKEPGQRYASAAELAEDLRRFQAGKPIAARAVGPAERAWRWSRRNPGWAAMLATVAGLLVAIASVASGLSVWALRAERAARRQLFEAKLEQARATRSSQRPGQRFVTLKLLEEAADLARELALPADHFADLRNATIAALLLPDLHPQPTAVAFPADAVGGDFDADFRLCARTHNDGSCRILRVADGVELHHIPGLGLEKDYTVPYLSRDGRFVAVGHQDGRMRLWQLDGAEPEMLFEEPHAVNWIDFDAAGRHVAFAHSDGRISRYELARGGQVNRLPADALYREVSIALHPDPAKPLAAVTSYFGREVQVRNLKTGAVEKRIVMPRSPGHVAWHPTHHTLIVREGNGGSLHLFDGTTFARLRTFGSLGGSSFLTFNHDGSCLAAASWGPVVEFLDFATGRELATMPCQRTPLTLRFSRDDRQLAGFVADGRLNVWEVAAGRAYRPLARPNPPQGVSYGRPALSPDGRLLAVLMSDGVGFWDLEARRWLDFLKLDRQRYFVHFTPDGALLLTDESGTYRWPVRRDRAAPSLWRFGPPEALALPPGDAVAQSADGRMLAVGCRRIVATEPWAGAWVLHTDRPDKPESLDVGKDIESVALSPDGRWLITALHTHETVHVWDMQLGGPPRKLVDSGWSPVFSSDGRRLLVAGTPGGLFDVETWQRLRDVDHWGCFSPDGQTLAQSTSTHVLRLVETDTGRELAQLEAPGGLIGASSYLFTPDGTRLVTVNTVHGVHVCDLRLLRQELKERNQDWDGPAYGPARAPGEPLRVAFDRGNFDELRRKQRAANLDRAVAAGPKLAVRWYYRGRFHLTEGRPEEALADLRKAVEVAPSYPVFCNALAWFLVTGPEHLRDAGKAVELADRAVKERPGDWQYHTTLGVAYYRAGRAADAVTELEASLRGQAGEADAYDLYFLAMCHHRLGDAVKARECYSRAMKWMAGKIDDLRPENAAELEAFQAEADAVLAATQHSSGQDR
jgi:WD40 repeat protein/tRNA A-37 threonylcarbamoyl transferase component Bud32/Tfp pilus assembly protein PilF